MAKGITSGQQTLLEGAHHIEVMFIEADLPTGVQRFTTAGMDYPYTVFDPGSLTINWLGGLNPTSIGPLRETESGEAVGLEITISGVPSAQRAIALNEDIQSRRLTIWFVPVHPTSYAIQETPVKEFEGLLDTMDITVEPDGTCTIKISVESKMARMMRPNILRYTDSDHQFYYPGDTICRHTSQLEKTLIWPNADALRQAQQAA